MSKVTHIFKIIEFFLMFKFLYLNRLVAILVVNENRRRVCRVLFVELSESAVT